MKSYMLMPFHPKKMKKHMEQLGIKKKKRKKNYMTEEEERRIALAESGMTSPGGGLSPLQAGPRPLRKGGLVTRGSDKSRLTGHYKIV